MMADGVSRLRVARPCTLVTIGAAILAWIDATYPTPPITRESLPEEREACFRSVPAYASFRERARKAAFKRGVALVVEPGMSESLNVGVVVDIGSIDSDLTVLHVRSYRSDFLLHAHPDDVACISVGSDVVFSRSHRPSPMPGSAMTGRSKRGARAAS
jgi:hypothetical protein